MLKVISGNNLYVPSFRIPAGIYVSFKIDETTHWKSAIRVPSSNNSVAWDDTVTLSSHASPTLSVEIRASFEIGRMLGNGELIGKLEMSWDELQRHGNEPFDLSFNTKCFAYILQLPSIVPESNGTFFDIIADSSVDHSV